MNKDYIVLCLQLLVSLKFFKIRSCDKINAEREIRLTKLKKKFWQNWQKEKRRKAQINNNKNEKEGITTDAVEILKDKQIL